jgi:hypothetical protein
MHLGALVFGLLMAAAIAANIWLENDLAAQAPTLESTRGTVSVSEFHNESRRGRATIIVQYTVRGRTRTVQATSRAIEGHEQDSPAALVRAFPVGATLPVYYHPGEPAIAVLARPGGAARSGEIVVWWVGLALSLAFCVAIVVRFVRRA